MGSSGFPEGKSFGFDDLVFYRGKGEVPFDEVAGRIDLILTGPHATAAIPRELEPFLEPGLTQRLQHDFSDMTTSDLCKRWVEVDERAVYVEFPHHRILFDPNRDWPADPEAGLREFFARRDAQVSRRERLLQRRRLHPARLVQRGALPASTRERRASGAR